MDFTAALEAMRQGQAINCPGWGKVELFYLKDNRIIAVYHDCREMRITRIPVSLIFSDQWQVVDAGWAEELKAAVCPNWGQKDEGQTGKHPCQVCGLSTMHDAAA